MKNICTVERCEAPASGKCPLCSLDAALVMQVTYYRFFSFPVCRVCGRALARHITWLGAAHKRYLQNRTRNGNAAG